MLATGTNFGLVIAITAIYSGINTQLHITNYLLNFLCVTVFLIIPTSIIYHLYIYPLISPFRGLPTAPQAPVHQRLLKEVRGHHALLWLEKVPNNGLIRYFGFLNVECLFLTSPAAFKEILDTKTYRWVKPPKSTSLFKLLIGDGLITLEGQAHKQQRRLLQPSFGFRQIQDLHPSLWGKVNELLGGIEKDISREENDKVVNIQDWMGRTTLDLIGVAGFGFDFNAISDPESTLVSQYRRLFGIKPSPITQVLTEIIPTTILRYLPTKALEDVRVSTTAIKTYLSTAIQEKKAKLAEPEGKVSDKDILSVAMQDPSYSEQQLIDHSMTFLGAGQDTTAFTLTCAIMELSQNQQLQDKLRREIRSNVRNPRSPGFGTDTDDLNGLPWLSAVINETLRCYPSVDAIGRVSLEADAVVAGQKIPKGTIVNIPVTAVNQYSKFWAGTSYDPIKWHPERWFDDINDGKLNSTGGAINGWAMMTFSKGTRQCIGERFARAEMAVVLAGLVGRFSFQFQGASGRGKPMAELDMFYGFTGHIMGGFWTTVKVVEGW
jgi:cytochrome P450